MTGLGKNYADAKTIVIKSGTGFLFGYESVAGHTQSRLVFRDQQLEGYIEEVCALIDKGKNIAIVASGAVPEGKLTSYYAIEQIDDNSKAELAGIGQAEFYMRFRNSFRKHGRLSAQCLITREDLGSPKRLATIQRHQRDYFAYRVTAVYNENDNVAIEEITFGDNDILSAELACAIDADLLIMLSDPTEGLGTGGGSSKQMARGIAAKKGIPMEIINGEYIKNEKGVYLPKIMELF